MKHSWKHILSLLLAAAMLFALVCPALADNEDAEAPSGQYTVTWEKIDAQPRGISAPTFELAEDAITYGPNDVVRVSIVLEQLPAIKAGFSKRNIGSNASVQSYRDSLRLVQDSVAQKISTDVLGGAKLDVVWNLTLAANLISANVPYGKIEAIKAVPGVKDVVIEMQYNPTESVNMSNASQMVGSQQVWSTGYTGAGSIVAIIDTGIDTQHELFDADAFDYSIGKVEGNVDLLTSDEVVSKWESLNISEYFENSNGVYLSTKIPFAVNYIDLDLDVTHANDDQGEHGSHVSGIAAGNRYVKRGEEFANALEEVYTQGQAPDAQLLVMKVFGKGGGAYDSDYMAAIEDAIILGADAVNLSLGSSVAGFVTSDENQKLMDDLADSLYNTDTVVAMSAGNSYEWPYYAAIPYLYSDGVNFDTVGSPGSFTNSLAVASVENDGVTTPYLTAYDEMVFYNESFGGYGNRPMQLLARDEAYAFVYIDSPGIYTDDDDNIIGNDFAEVAEEIPLQGKIVICNRGTSYFYMKANGAIAQGAVAAIIANNQPGTIGLALSDYEYTAPVVSISLDDAQMLKAKAEKTTINNIDVYTGEIEVSTEIYNEYYGEHNYTMSDFSSWGVPGDLSLKPEITAPGGNIWSVNGLVEGGHNSYENMSGTSMASPQIAGITALVAQYIRENDLQTTLTPRQLITSLLMSTAVPLKEKDSGNYYSVMKQGAGLVDAEAAVSSKTYITMNADATASYADGKVKVELGDDPARSGVYSFSFNINNLTDTALTYDVRGDFFTQDLFATAYGILQDTWTTPLDADIVWTADGEVIDAEGGVDLDFNGDEVYDDDDATALLEYVVKGIEPKSLDGADFDGDGKITTYDAYLALSYVGGASVTVPASGSVKIGVTVTLNDIDNYDDCGAYIEGYIFATGRATEEGVLGTEHSIPVIGYYGSWSEPTMHDVGSLLEYQYEEEDRLPYMYAALGEGAFTTEGYGVRYAGDPNAYALGGNPVEYDEEYLPERDSIAPDSTIIGVNYSLIRNSAGGILRVYVDDVKAFEKEINAQYAAYYYANQQKWLNTTTSAKLNKTAGSFEGVREGSNITVEYLMAPEYYQNKNGKIDWSRVSTASALTYTAVVDGIAPAFKDVRAETEEESGAVTAVNIEVKENRYVAGILVWNEEDWFGGKDPMLYIPADPAQNEGEIFSAQITAKNVDFTVEGNNHLMLQVFDYAGNYATYKLNLETEPPTAPTGLTVLPAKAEIFAGASIRLTAHVQPWGIGDECKWMSDNERVAKVDENGVVTGVSAGSATITAVSLLDSEITDFAVITVKDLPDVNLNAALWDENGKVNIIGIDVGRFVSDGSFNVLKEDIGIPISDMTWSLDGRTVYAADLPNPNAIGSTLYTLDPRSLELTPIGTNTGWSFMGLAPSVAFAAGIGSMSCSLATICSTYFICLDASSGAAIGGFDMADYFDIADFVGIAYLGSNMLDEYGLYCDYYIVIDSNSDIYLFNFMYSDGTIYQASFYFDCEKIGSVQAPIGDTWFYNSLYWAEDPNTEKAFLFWSRYTEDSDYVDMYMIPVLDFGFDEDNYPFIYAELDDPARIGGFDENVWPVAGLIELKPAKSEGIGSAGDGNLDEESLKIPHERFTPASFVEDIAADFASKTPAGSLNSVSVTSAGTRSIEVVTPPPAADYYVVITPDQTNHNGLVTVNYEPSEVELVACESAIEAYNVISVDEDEGEIKIGYATRDMVYEGYTEVLVLAFKMLEEVESVVSYTVEQVDDDFKAKEPVEDIIGSYEYGEPVWTIADDYMSATATFTATADDSIVVEVEAEVKVETFPAPSPFLSKKVYTYTVVFRGNTYTKEVVVMTEPSITPPGGDPTPGSDEPDEPEEDIPFPFEDVYETDWYYDAVYEMYKAGYIKGTSETTYEPNEDISRAQIVTILYRIDGENKVESGEPFTDVDVGAWYFDSVCWAYAKGIVKGTSDTTFEPDVPVTREQFAAIIYRYAQFRGDAVRPTGVTLDGYTDGGSVSDWAKEAMTWCVANKLIQGTGENALDPQSNATRGQAAVIFSRMIKLFE